MCLDTDTQRSITVQNSYDLGMGHSTNLSNPLYEILYRGMKEFFTHYDSCPLSLSPWYIDEGWPHYHVHNDPTLSGYCRARLQLKLSSVLVYYKLSRTKPMNLYHATQLEDLEIIKYADLTEYITKPKGQVDVTNKTKVMRAI